MLLAAQLGGVLLYPFMEESSAGQAAFSVFGILVLALAVLAIRATPFLSWISVLIAAPAVVLLVAQVVTRNNDLFPWSSAFEAALYLYAALSMLAYMLKDDRVTRDELFAIGTVFTLFAWAFAYIYVVLQALQPGTFSPDGVDRSWMELLYMSFTVLSGVGLSDVGPIGGHARSVVMIEEAVGVFYIAMTVTRLVGMRALKARS